MHSAGKKLMMKKIHLHETQFDKHMYAACGRGNNAVWSDEFAATDPDNRCKFCERIWFPNGQPEWHLKASKEIWNDQKKV